MPKLWTQNKFSESSQDAQGNPLGILRSLLVAYWEFPGKPLGAPERPLGASCKFLGAPWEPHGRPWSPWEPQALLLRAPGASHLLILEICHLASPSFLAPSDSFALLQGSAVSQVMVLIERPLKAPCLRCFIHLCSKAYLSRSFWEISLKGAQE